MTRKQRAQVVELLNKAASLETYHEQAHGSFLRSAALELQAPWEIESIARLACCYVIGDGTSRSIQSLAAQRVEEGSWP